jgi:uncharacterized membrane protein YfcA
MTRTPELQPGSQISLGCLLAIGGCIGTAATWFQGLATGASALAALLGVIWICLGAVDLHRLRQQRREARWAMDHWLQLALGAHAAQRRGSSIARYLQASGMRHHAVRRWFTKLLDARGHPPPEKQGH